MLTISRILIIVILSIVTPQAGAQNDFFAEITAEESQLIKSYFITYPNTDADVNLLQPGKKVVFITGSAAMTPGSKARYLEMIAKAIQHAQPISTHTYTLTPVERTQYGFDLIITYWAKTKPSVKRTAKQVHESHINQIKKRSAVWNTAYNTRDSSTFYTLFDSLAVMSSAGGRWIGREECKRLCRNLYRIRPDISWNNTATKIEMNARIRVAYETGDWVENWTEKGDQTKSELTGKYWIMWRLLRNDWYIISAIFTPLTCTGSYCTRK